MFWVFLGFFCLFWFFSMPRKNTTCVEAGREDTASQWVLQHSAALSSAYGTKHLFVFPGSLSHLVHGVALQGLKTKHTQGSANGCSDCSGTHLSAQVICSHATSVRGTSTSTPSFPQVHLVKDLCKQMPFVSFFLMPHGQGPPYLTLSRE